jgi:hypothetical protein
MSIQLRAQSQIPLFMERLQLELLREQEDIANDIHDEIYNTCRVDTGFMRSTLETQTSINNDIITSTISMTAPYSMYVESRYHTIWNAFIKYEDAFQAKVQAALNRL